MKKQNQRISVRMMEKEFEPFKVPFKGEFYFQKDVDDYISSTATEVEDLEDKFTKLHQHYISLKEKVSEVANHNNKVTQEVDFTPEEAEEVIVNRSNNQVSDRMLSHMQALLNDAEQRSSVILEEAKLEKEKIINEAKEEAERIIFNAQREAKQTVFEAQSKADVIAEKASEKAQEIKYYNQELQRKHKEMTTEILSKADELDNMIGRFSSLSQKIKEEFGNEQSA